MATFDIITSVGLAYKTTWSQRAYLARMAMIPFSVKLACFVTLMYLGEDVSGWITSIIFLPAFFLEGWLLTHWARTIMTGGVHRWPFKPSGDEVKDMREITLRGRGVMAGTLAYVLTNFLIQGYFAFLKPLLPKELDTTQPDPNIALMGLIMMVTSIFLFRFLWFYIPLSVNIKWTFVIEKLKPINLTFKFIGLWLICVIPAVFVLQLSNEAIVSVIGNEGNNAIAETGFVLVRTMVDMTKNLICTAGIAFAFLALFQPKPKTK